jgi:hypothetical protein
MLAVSKFLDFQFEEASINIQRCKSDQSQFLSKSAIFSHSKLLKLSGSNFLLSDCLQQSAKQISAVTSGSRQLYSVKLEFKTKK